MAGEEIQPGGWHPGWLFERTVPDLGLAKFTAIGVSDYMQTCIKYSVWLIFMIYRMNEDKFDHIKAKHARIALARKTRAQRAVAA